MTGVAIFLVVVAVAWVGGLLKEAWDADDSLWLAIFCAAILWDTFIIVRIAASS